MAKKNIRKKTNNTISSSSLQLVTSQNSPGGIQIINNTRRSTELTRTEQTAHTSAGLHE